MAGALGGANVSFFCAEGECVFGSPCGLRGVPIRRERRGEVKENVGTKRQQVGRVQELVSVGGKRNGVVGLPARRVNRRQQGAPARLGGAAAGWRSGAGNIDEPFRFGVASLPEQGAGEQCGDDRAGLQHSGHRSVMARLVEHGLGRRRVSGQELEFTAPAHGCHERIGVAEAFHEFATFADHLPSALELALHGPEQCQCPEHPDIADAQFFSPLEKLLAPGDARGDRRRAAEDRFRQEPQSPCLLAVDTTSPCVPQGLFCRLLLFGCLAATVLYRGGD